MSDSIKLPELPQAWGTMYGKHQDKELDGYTADQMRGYAQDSVIAALAAAPAAPQQDDAKDAARYRYLREHLGMVSLDDYVLDAIEDHADDGELDVAVDDAIEAAMLRCT